MIQGKLFLQRKNPQNCYPVLHRLERATCFARVHLVDLLISCILGRSIDNLSQGHTLLRVGEDLGIEDLELPVFLDKSEDLRVS